MAAQTLHCPSCGVSTSIDAHRCLYCGSQLATIACPSCFGMIFRGSEYCHRCGTRVELAQTTADGKSCPRCDGAMHAKRLGDTSVAECEGCGGLWIDAAAFERICNDRQRHAAVVAAELPPPMPASESDERFYLKCPECRMFMSRTNFARHSGVVIDICKQHGMWFDRDELRRIIEFIRAGGMDHVRQCELDQIERAQREIQRAGLEAKFDNSTSAFLMGRERKETIDFVRAIGSLLRFF